MGSNIHIHSPSYIAYMPNRSGDVEPLHRITDRMEIAGYQQRFAARLRGAGDGARRITVGFQGDNVDINACWFPREKFWWGYEKLPDAPIPRHWNAFGCELLGGSKSHTIACEINVPLYEADWRVAGAFARDSVGMVHIVHTGSVNGVPLALFKEHFAMRELWTDVRWDGKRRDVVDVSELDDDALVRSLGDFVREVRRIKSLVRK